MGTRRLCMVAMYLAGFCSGHRDMVEEDLTVSDDPRGMGESAHKPANVLRASVPHHISMESESKINAHKQNTIEISSSLH